MKSLFLALFLAFLFPLQAVALSSEWQRDEDIAVRIISFNDAVGADGDIILGLEVDMADGWHTYWRSPGDAGVPPQIDWKNAIGSEGNLLAAEMMYPAPRRYDVFGMQTIGYKDKVIFPIKAKAKDVGRALDINASVSLLACSSICVPKNFDVALNIPSGRAVKGAEASLLDEALSTVPKAPEQAGFAISDVADDKQALTFIVSAKEAFKSLDVFIENEKDVEFASPKIELDEARSSAKVSFGYKLSEGIKLSEVPLLVTFVDGDNSAEFKLFSSVSASNAKPLSIAGTKGGLTLYMATLLAVLGGFILNLMPCVLPVLSLKVVGFIKAGSADAKDIRRGFLSTAMGIEFFMIALAAIMIALKGMGQQIGWGIQFQHPAFLMFIIVVLTLFAANLWGFFEIPLPRFIAAMANRADGKVAGDFLSGVFAALLATPCSAPFLGVAVGFALAAGALEILAVFAALGFGLALPYLAVVVFPKSVSFLPKPGIWMITLRRFLGGALAVAGLWFIWILSAQIHVGAAAFFACMMAFILLLLASTRGHSSRKIVLASVMAACLAACGAGFYGVRDESVSRSVADKWAAFDEMAIERAVADGKTVFLDITADWCLTCKVNEKFVLSGKDVSDRLFGGDIIAMQADWTSSNPVVSEFLRKHGRYGVPFNIVFGPGAKQGIILPELLTSSAVIEALDAAEGGS